MRNRIGWGLALALGMMGSWLIGHGLWIPAKAIVAQWLLEEAWADTLQSQRLAKPWPWADTWPVGRLRLPHHGIDQIILADASGRSLAFGPGQVGNHRFPDGKRTLILSGHRDTHFSFVQNVQLGETLSVQTLDGQWHHYTVGRTAILDSRTDQIVIHQPEEGLMLITCYPFDTLFPGGPLRYVIEAQKNTPLGKGIRNEE